ncbi:hypothetical protein QLX08_010320 [Tetragonisca angustula]|uniref:Uncharacterized protein n=1 Tax=Tetragonisca angustula TaxID=166442 RepID=A0AAW0ZCW8_9HYME
MLYLPTRRTHCKPCPIENPNKSSSKTYAYKNPTSSTQSINTDHIPVTKRQTDASINNEIEPPTKDTLEIRNHRKEKTKDPKTNKTTKEHYP